MKFVKKQCLISKYIFNIHMYWLRQVFLLFFYYIVQCTYNIIKKETWKISIKTLNSDALHRCFFWIQKAEFIFLDAWIHSNFVKAGPAPDTIALWILLQVPLRVPLWVPLRVLLQIALWISLYRNFTIKARALIRTAH